MADTQTGLGRVFKGRFGIRAGWKVLAFFGPGFAMTLLGAVAGSLVVAGLGMALPELPPLVPLLVVGAPVYAVFPLWGLLCARLLDGTTSGSGTWGPRWRSFVELLGGVVLGGLINLFGLVCLMLLAETGAVNASVATEWGLELRDLLALIGWLALFAMAATWEEAVFRGYGFVWAGRALANVLRWLVDLVGENSEGLDRVIEWVGRAPILIVSSVLFGLLHVGNPGSGGLLGLMNTILAGIWLAIAVYKTRALWMAIGLHFGWNATMGVGLGIPVSGAGGDGSPLELASALSTTLTGPNWYTGGAYGLEGSAGCTAALVLACVVSMVLPQRPQRDSMAAVARPAIASSTRS